MVGTLITVRETGDAPWNTKDEMAFPSDRPIQAVIERVAFEGRPHHRLVIDLNPDGTFQVCNETVVDNAVIPRGRMRGTLGEGSES